MQGAPNPPSYTRFRQSNEFYYLCGIETPHAYLLWTARRRRRRSFCPTATRGASRARARCSRPRTPTRSRSSRASTRSSATDLLAEHLEGKYLQRPASRVLYTPLAPAEGRLDEPRPRDALRRPTPARIPFDGRPSREGTLRPSSSRRASRSSTVKDLSPTLDALRLIKSPRELAMIRKATRLAGPRAPRGDALDAAGPVRARARRRRQVRLLPQRRAGRRVLLAHRQRPERLLAALQRRQAQDAGRRLPADGLRAGLRLLHERRHAHVAGQREVLAVAARALRLLPRLLPRDPEGDRPGKTGAQVISQAGGRDGPDPRRGEVLEAVAPQGRRGLRRRSTRRAAESEYPYLGHWVGMATHDVGLARGAAASRAWSSRSSPR